MPRTGRPAGKSKLELWEGLLLGSSADEGPAGKLSAKAETQA